MTNLEINAVVAERVMGWVTGKLREESTGWISSRGVPFVRIGSNTSAAFQPTTNASDDYTVLVKVRETWSGKAACAFADRLCEIWEKRGGCGYMVLYAGAYEPGDYSRAALAALGVDVKGAN